MKKLILALMVISMLQSCTFLLYRKDACGNYPTLQKQKGKPEPSFNR